MTSGASSPWRWIKLGCLTLVLATALLVAWTAVLFGTAYRRGQNESVAVRELSRTVSGSASTEVPGASRPQNSRSPVGRVVLDLTVGEFQIRPGAPGEPIRVDAEYDTRSYRLTEAFEPSTEAPWTYRITFEETDWFKDGGLRALLGGSFPRIDITLPTDVPLALEGSFAKGGTDFDLGGLWLTHVDLNMEKGGLNVHFSEPLAAPLERLTIRAKQGGMSVGRVGNASPRVVDVRHSMGGGAIDLRGDWVCDSEVRLSGSMGGNDLWLPRGVVIEGLGGSGFRAPPAEPEETPLPRLKLSVSSVLGRMHVVEPR